MFTLKLSLATTAALAEETVSSTSSTTTSTVSSTSTSTTTSTDTTTTVVPYLDCDVFQTTYHSCEEAQAFLSNPHFYNRHGEVNDYVLSDLCSVTFRFDKSESKCGAGVKSLNFTNPIATANRMETARYFNIWGESDVSFTIPGDLSVDNVAFKIGSVALEVLGSFSLTRSVPDLYGMYTTGLQGSESSLVVRGEAAFDLGVNQMALLGKVSVDGPLKLSGSDEFHKMDAQIALADTLHGKGGIDIENTRILMSPRDELFRKNGANITSPALSLTDAGFQYQTLLNKATGQNNCTIYHVAGSVTLNATGNNSITAKSTKADFERMFEPACGNATLEKIEVPADVWDNCAKWIYNYTYHCGVSFSNLLLVYHAVLLLAAVL